MSKLLKSLIASILLVALVFSITACGGGDAEPSQESFESAYDDKIDELADSISAYYDRIGNYKLNDMSVDAELSVNLSKDLLTLIRNYTGYDFKWLNDAKIEINENVKNDMMSAALGLVYKGSEIAAAEFIMDYADGDMFFGVPVLNSKFAKAEDMFEEEELALIKQLMSIDITKFLPDEELLANVLSEIFATVMENLDQQVEFEEIELEANGVTQSCVAYEVDLSQKDVLKIARDVLKMLKGNADFKELVCNFIDEYNKVAKSMDMDDLGKSSSVYNELKSMLDEAVEELDELIKESSSKSLAIWTSYVTGKLDIIGMQVDIVGENTTFFMAKAQDGDAVGVEVYLKSGKQTMAGIYGELVDDGGEISGTYEIKVHGSSMAYIDIANVDADKLDQGYFVGSIKISPSKGLIDILEDEFDLEDLSFAGLAVSNLALKIDVEENSKDAFKMTISVMNGKEAYASLTMAGEVSSGEKISTPSKTVDMEAWAEGIDFEDLIEKIEKSGLPDYIVELFEDITR